MNVQFVIIENILINMFGVNLGKVYCSNCDYEFHHFWNSSSPTYCTLGKYFCPFCEKETLVYLDEV